MRKALFAVVLVSASFAGGAVANGPGLRWAQAMVLNRLGIEGEESDDVGHAATAGPNTSSSSSTTSEEAPARPIPPLVLEPPAATTTATARRPAAPTPAAPTQDPSSSASVLPNLTPVPEAPPTPDPIPPLSASLEHAEPDIPHPSAATPEADPVKVKVKTADKDQDHDVDAAVRRVSVTGLVPVPGDAAPAGEWASIREAMRGLGVSRYGIEGDPAGRVRFHCVIPLAGRRAVGQHFEAEGDDDLQAARAALKRVALWKATEGGESSAP